MLQSCAIFMLVIELLRLFLYAFGGVFLLGLIAVGRQLAMEHLSDRRQRTRRPSIEGCFLFVAAVVVAVFYAGKFTGEGGIPAIGRGWLLAYAVCCATYLAVKAVRMVRTHR